MATRAWIVPVGVDGSITITDQKEYKLRALAAGYERCSQKSIGNVNADIPGLDRISASQLPERLELIYRHIATKGKVESVDVRQLDPMLDFVAPTALDDWLTAALAAVGTFYSCFQGVAAPQLIAGKLMVVYGVSIGTVPIPVSQLRIRKNGAAGNILTEYDLQSLESRGTLAGLFSEPQVFDPQDIFAIQARASIATGVAARVYIENYLFENKGGSFA